MKKTDRELLIEVLASQQEALLKIKDVEIALERLRQRLREGFHHYGEKLDYAREDICAINNRLGRDG